MNIEEKIIELEERIKRNKEALLELDKLMIRMSGPQGLPSGTSYELHDNIRGGNKEIDLFKYVTDRERLKTFIEIDEKILSNLIKNLKLKEDIKLMPNNSDRVILMKSLGYSTKQIADELFISDRHIRRIIRRYYKKDEESPK